MSVEDGSEEFLDGYLTAALFTLSDTGGRVYTANDFTRKALIQAQRECAEFLQANTEAVGDDYYEAGVDFWLTRNRHGAGFWDGDWIKEDGKRLTAAAHAAGEREVIECYPPGVLSFYPEA